MPSPSSVEKTPAARAALVLCLWFASCVVAQSAAASETPALKPARPMVVQSPSAMALQPGAAAPPADPMDQLRQRLAERLAAGKAAAIETPSNDLRVVARPAAGSAAGGGTVRAPAAAAKAVSAKTTERRAPAQPAAAGHWTYAGATGPTSWGGACNSGQRQSPIDIRGGLAVDLEPVQFAYTASRFGVVDNGHTVQVNMAAGNHIAIGGRRFDLQQFHFHRPSEERIDGRQFEMSVHLVHKDEQGRLAVVTVLLDKGHGSVQPVVQKVWNNLPLERGEEATARAPLDLNELLPVDRKYYTYMGSLTTPPCSEGVQWVVMRQPVTVTAEQIELFARIYPMNSRPLQAAAGRRILQSN